MGLFSRKKKTETEKAKARGKTKSKRQVARARVQRGAGKGTRNVVYFLDQAPLYKLLGLGLALYGINKVVGAIGEAFADEDVNTDPVDTPIKTNLLVNLRQYYNPSQGNWEESTFGGIFNDDKFWYTLDGSGYADSIPPQTSQTPGILGAKSIENYAGTILGYITSNVDVDALSNASICELMNYLLTVALTFSDDEIKALHNASLILVGQGETLVQELKNAQSHYDWGVLPFQEAFLMVQTRLIANGSVKQ